jgi:hypothetical protein
MISEDSFFKKIPLAINLEQRLTWEGAGWAIQMIDLSYNKLKAAASQVDATLATYPTFLATEMFACCWSIIDQCHMLRKILERAPLDADGLAAKFIKKFEAVTFIRNAMDHLHQNINNVANKKGPISPIFGALSFCVITDDDISSSSSERDVPIIKGRTVVTLTAGALTHPQNNFQVVSPTGRHIEIPVGMFHFMAFEHRVDFSDMIMDLALLVAHFDNVVKPDQERQLREFARTSNLDESKVVSEHRADFAVAIQLKFPNAVEPISGPPDENSSSSADAPPGRMA